MSREMFQVAQRVVAAIGIIAAGATPFAPQINGMLKNGEIDPSEPIPVSDTIDGMKLEGTDSNDVSSKEHDNLDKSDDIEESIDINDILNDLKDSDDLADNMSDLADDIKNGFDDSEKRKKDMEPKENNFKF